MDVMFGYIINRFGSFDFYDNSSYFSASAAPSIDREPVTAVRVALLQSGNTSNESFCGFVFVPLVFVYFRKRRGNSSPAHTDM